VTPRSLGDTTRLITVKHGGKNERADGVQKTIYLVFKRLIIMWLSLAQQRKCSNSTEMSVSVFSGTTNVVSSANLNNIFITDKGFKSLQCKQCNNVKSGVHVDWLKKKKKMMYVLPAVSYH